MRSVRPESLAIAALLAATLVFGFGLLPPAIQVGATGMGTGLSPRFLPQIATASIALALAWGLFRSFTDRLSSVKPAETVAGNPRRPLLAAVVCLAFATFGFDLAGFYLGGIVMAILLTLLLGERRILLSILFPTLLLAVIYVVFELGLAVRLPKSGLFPALPL